MYIYTIYAMYTVFILNASRVPTSPRRPVAEDSAETAGTGAGIAAGAAARARAGAGGGAGPTARPKPGIVSEAIGTAVLRRSESARTSATDEAER